MTASAVSDPKVIDAINAERIRCVEIVQLARFGEIDQDWRTVIYFIESGMSLDQIKETQK